MTSLTTEGEDTDKKFIKRKENNVPPTNHNNKGKNKRERIKLPREVGRDPKQSASEFWV
jgi:hypothetical protein